MVVFCARIGVTIMIAKATMMATAELSHKTPTSTRTASKTEKIKIVQRLDTRNPAPQTFVLMPKMIHEPATR